MPPPKETLEDLVDKQGLQPDVFGTDNARSLTKLKGLSYTSVLTDSYNTFCALSLLFRTHAAAQFQVPDFKSCA